MDKCPAALNIIHVFLEFSHTHTRSSPQRPQNVCHGDLLYALGQWSSIRIGALFTLERTSDIHPHKHTIVLRVICTKSVPSRCPPFSTVTWVCGVCSLSYTSVRRVSATLPRVPVPRKYRGSSPYQFAIYTLYSIARFSPRNWPCVLVRGG